MNGVGKSLGLQRLQLLFFDQNKNTRKIELCYDEVFRNWSNYSQKSHRKLRAMLYIDMETPITVLFIIFDNKNKKNY